MPPLSITLPVPLTDSNWKKYVAVVKCGPTQKTASLWANCEAVGYVVWIGNCGGTVQ